MFIKTYKTTIKRIFRSPIFLLCLVVIIVIVTMDAHNGFYGKDKEPDFVLAYEKYHEAISNLFMRMVRYAIPFLCVVTVMPVVGGDYSDNFFEIEKAGGVRSATYFFGRFLAILSVAFVITLILSLFSVNYYFFTRGGVASLHTVPENYVLEWPIDTLGEYIIDSTKVTVRLVVTCLLPVIILFTSVTYAIGAFLESGLLAGIGGSVATVIAYLAAMKYQWMFDSTVYKYFLPARIGSFTYMACYDTIFNTPEYIAERGLGHILDTFEGVMTWIVSLLCISLVCILISYVCTSRRKI